MNAKSPTVLVVDDDPFVREIMELVLESEGYHVETAEDGVRALEKWRSGIDIDALVSDMHMPGMGGMELTAELRETNVDIPIILLTGNSESPAALEAVKNGANDCLVKDENIQETIITALEKVLEGYRKKTSS